jgi:hypothetical protein
MTAPFIPWPGADGILTSNMWAWWFPTRPQFLGPVPLREEPERLMLGSSHMGQDFNAKPTPPPCSVGWIPVVDRGVVKCIPGSMPSGMMTMTPHPRTFPVKSYYGWREV